jgi:hypothetical protein
MLTAGDSTAAVRVQRKRMDGRRRRRRRKRRRQVGGGGVGGAERTMMRRNGKKYIQRNRAAGPRRGVGAGKVAAGAQCAAEGGRASRVRG